MSPMSEVSGLEKKEVELIPDTIRQVRQSIEYVKMIELQVERLATARLGTSPPKSNPETGDKKPSLYEELSYTLSTLDSLLANACERLAYEVVYLLGRDN